MSAMKGDVAFFCMNGKFFCCRLTCHYVLLTGGSSWVCLCTCQACCTPETNLMCRPLRRLFIMPERISHHRRGQYEMWSLSGKAMKRPRRTSSQMRRAVLIIVSGLVKNYGHRPKDRYQGALPDLS